LKVDRLKVSVRLLPTTTLGWWSIAAVAALSALLVVFFAAVAAGQRGGNEFSDNLWLAIPAFGAGVAGVAAGIAGGAAFGLSNERSVAAAFALVVGIGVMLFLAGELLVAH
jgi:hypothetical protein